MPDLLERRVVDIVQDTLRSTVGDSGLVVSIDDSMETLPAWDSLTFMTVFLAINDAFNLNPDFDDAVHYMAIPSLVSYLRDHVWS